MMPLSIDTFFLKNDWDRVLGFFPEHDFTHTFDFHRISQDNDEGLPIMFAVRETDGSYLACWPALKREIPGTNFFDLTSVYGYSGPLFANEDVSEKCFNLILGAIQEMRAITFFSRMHPIFIDQVRIQRLRGEKLGDVIVIEAQRHAPLASYRSGHRYEIRKALSNGLKIHVDHDCEMMSHFVEIYQQAMRDLNAPDFYFFKPDYFDRLRHATDFKTFLIFAEIDSKSIAASMFIVTGRIMQYYLSGTLHAYRKLSPSKAIIAKAHEIAISMGVEKMILGGGVGSREDELFKFKNGFSEIRKPFYIFKQVIDSNVYTALCESRRVDSRAISYFPAYRLPQSKS